MEKLLLNAGVAACLLIGGAAMGAPDPMVQSGWWEHVIRPKPSMMNHGQEPVDLKADTVQAGFHWPRPTNIGRPS